MPAIQEHVYLQYTNHRIKLKHSIKLYILSLLMSALAAGFNWNPSSSMQIPFC